MSELQKALEALTWETAEYTNFPLKKIVIRKDHAAAILEHIAEQDRRIAELERTIAIKQDQMNRDGDKMALTADLINSAMGALWQLPEDESNEHVKRALKYLSHALQGKKL